MRGVVAVAFMVAMLYCGAFALEYLPDPSFENPVSPNWEVYGLGMGKSTETKMDARESVYGDAGSSLSRVFGLSTLLKVGQSSPAAIRISGWSLSNSSISLPSDANYAIYTDVEYSDNSYQWGVNVPFAAGPTHTWQYQCDTIIPDKEISSLTVYPMFRLHSGVAYFDKFSVSTYTLESVVTSSTNPLKILVPLYTYPGSAWDVVQSSAVNVSTTVIANVNSGPGSSLDPNYAKYIDKLVGGKPQVPVLGYVHTEYGARSIAVVQAEILAWKTYYPNITGIFLDEASSSLDNLAYYQSLSFYIKSKLGAAAMVFLNPGESTPENYTSSSDSIMFFESDYSAFTVAQDTVPLPSGWPRAPCFTPYTTTWKYKSNAVIYDVSNTQYKAVVDKVIEKGFGYVYVTDATLPNPYQTLPSYWSSLVAYIESKNV